MSGFLAGATVAVTFAAILAGLLALGRRVRRRGRPAGQAFLGPFEEMWHPAAHRARAQTEIVEERMAPRPSADDEIPPRRG